MKGLIKSSATLLVVAGVGLSHNVFSADTQIKITGNVVASECETTVEGNSGTVIDLGQIQATALLNAGDKTPAVPFKINFKNCPVTTTGYIATFKGTAESGTTDFVNEGTAKKVQVRVTNTDNKDVSVLENGGLYTAPKSLSGSGVLNLKAQAVTAQGQTTPGSIQATIQLNVQFT